MSAMMKFNFNNNDITRHVVNGDPWFKAKEVASVLGYANTKQAQIKNVSTTTTN